MYKPYGTMVQPPFNIRNLFFGADADSGGLYTPNPLQYQTSVGGDPADDPAEPVGLVLSKLGNQQVGGTGINPSQSTAGSRVAVASVPVGAIRNRERNNAGIGGIPGTPGTQPDNWAGWTTTSNGIAPQLVERGTRNGLPYVRYRFAGTASASSTNTYAFEAANWISAASGQTWTHSFICALVDGALPVNPSIRIEGRQAGGTLNENNVTVIAPDSTDQRFSVSLTLAVGTTAFVQPRFQFSYTNGVAYDFTLDFIGSQCELAAAPSPLQIVSGLFLIEEAGVPSIDCYRMDSDWMTYGTGAFGSATAGFRATAADNWTVWLAFSTFSGLGTLIAQSNEGSSADRMFQVFVDAAGILSSILAGDVDNIQSGVNNGAWHFVSLRCTAGAVQSRVNRAAPATRDKGAAAAEAVNITAWARNSGTPAVIFTGYGLLPEFIDEALSDTQWDQLTSYRCNQLGIE